jgi:hypothetical protein
MVVLSISGWARFFGKGRDLTSIQAVNPAQPQLRAPIVLGD